MELFGIEWLLIKKILIWLNYQCIKANSLEQQDILRFWRDVEIFDLPDLNKDAALLKGDEVLPWLHKVRAPKQHYKWRYTLIFGKIEKKYIIDYLNTLLKSDKINDWEETVQGFSCFSALILDEEGRPQQDNYVTASYIFGINALEKKKELSTVSLDLEKVKEDFLERYNIPKVILEEKQNSPKGDVVYSEHIIREITYLDKLTLWKNQEIKVFLLTEEVPKDSEPNTGFLNSFYLDDLNYLSRLEKADLSATLQQYLTLEPNKNNRRDLIEQKHFLFDAIHPNQLTAGRWPSNVEHGLYTAQSGAVNTIFSNLKNTEGVQGVNGPPGTGKTTLLLDVIAEVVVERAKKISELGCSSIFNKGYHKIVKESGYDLYTYNLSSKLQNDFGIVVASNNNAAVENITKELPAKAKIDKSVFQNADYFSECSTKLIEEESWGILAAALGNAKNRSNFKKSFWMNNVEEGIVGFKDVLHDLYKDENNDKTYQYNNAFEQENEKFKSLLAEFEAFKKTASKFHDLTPEFIKNIKQEKTILKELKQIDKSLNELSKEEEILVDKQNDLKKDVERIQSTVQLHASRKPSFFFFQKLFGTRNFKIWNIQAGEIVGHLNKSNSELDILRQKLKGNNDKTQSLISKKKDLNTELSKLKTFFEGYKKLKNELNKKYEIDTQNIFDISFYEKEILDIHLLNPYHSRKIAKLRSEILLSALQLHHDVILANAKNVKNNLNAYFEMIAGWIKVDSKVSQNLWDTFFLCVPVVSTTLASASRLFPNINRKQIGWLLIDEAGQATPQSAAGLIHRSKRCVIVGDPLQVEPVVTMPEKLMLELRKEHNLPVDWSPYRVSVQQLADRVSRAGTYMTVGDTDQKIWTGFPLRTHRRCDDPMFSIANKIAYSDQMVKAINKNSEEKYIGASSWFNVNTEITLVNKHVVVEEINLLQQKIQELRNSGFKEDIYVISPFKSIATYCDSVFRGDKKVSCGTIHRFQGKEADIVFLVLGSDPKSSGARNWASQKPNMLNVALTRAKKRFYVIGNKKLWAACNYFDSMAKVLN
ncbi:DEAD/DEAH box helicase [Flavobacterium poyangense]|uniref:DEAD/DEAH box helicase n=1 Tax=Flavobacterium poyangense TaxID=2204302 RepID=UPI001FBAF3C2|nr:ATP-binding protein [Flavobacterium sp. JXAS1]